MAAPMHPPPQGKSSRSSLVTGLGFFPSSVASARRDPIAHLLESAPKITQTPCCLRSYDSTQEKIVSLPTFDLTALSRQGNEFLRALMEEGIVIIKPTLPPTLLNNVHQEMRRYFALPYDKKILDWKKDASYIGYQCLGSERGPKASLPDYKESFFIPQGFRNWPKVPMQFTRVLQEYTRTLSILSMQVEQMLVSAINKHLDFKRPQGHESYHLVRLCHYPPLTNNQHPQELWCAPHRDRNLFSLLSKASTPGLQFYSENQRWEMVNAPDGSFIFITGLLLQELTHNLIKARWHRVINPGGKYARMMRLSTISYTSWVS